MAANDVGFSWGYPYAGTTLYTVALQGTPNSTFPVYPAVNFSTVRSYHTGGAQLLMMDGAVRFISDNVNGTLWGAMHSPQSGEVLGEI